MKQLRKFLKKSKKRHPSLFRILKFIIKLNIFVIPLYLVLLLRLTFVQLQQLTADIVHWMITGSGIAAIKDALTITIPVHGGSWAASIIWDCTGWKSMLFMFALIFATDFSLKKKLWGLIFIPIIYAVNLVRIWFMFWYVSGYGLENYSLLHTTLWSWGMIVIVLIFWIIWIKYFLD